MTLKEEFMADEIKFLQKSVLRYKQHDIDRKRLVQLESELTFELAMELLAQIKEVNLYKANPRLVELFITVYQTMKMDKIECKEIGLFIKSDEFAKMSGLDNHTEPQNEIIKSSY